MTGPQQGRGEGQETRRGTLRVPETRVSAVNALTDLHKAICKTVQRPCLGNTDDRKRLDFECSTGEKAHDIKTQNGWEYNQRTPYCSTKPARRATKPWLAPCSVGSTRQSIVS